MAKKVGGRGPGERRITAGPRAHAKNWKALAVAALLVAALENSSKATAESNGITEYDVKAAFLFHFAQFVEWPAETFKDAGSPLTYCTVGRDPFHGVLEESVKGKSVGNHPLRVQHLKEHEPFGDCQVLFLAEAENSLEEQTLASTSGHPVLTVGETEHFAQAGGIIAFCLDENKVRFEINLDAAGKARLKISAKLLGLAKRVLGNPRGD